MTGREAAMYILVNHYDDKPLVVYIDGKAVPVYDIDYEISKKELVILPDYTKEGEEAWRQD